MKLVIAALTSKLQNTEAYPKPTEATEQHTRVCTLNTKQCGEKLSIYEEGKKTAFVIFLSNHIKLIYFAC